MYYKQKRLLAIVQYKFHASMTVLLTIIQNVYQKTFFYLYHICYYNTYIIAYT